MTGRRPVVVITGCTPLGAYLASKLDQDGCRVGVVDRSESAFTLLAEGFSGVCVEGEPLDLAVLERAGIGPTAHFIGTMPKDDLNLALGIVCRKTTGVRTVLVQVGDPARAGAYEDLGIKTVCPARLVGEELKRRITGSGNTGTTRLFVGGKMKTLFVVIVGCGRLGSHLANLLSHEGHRVVVVDRDDRAFEKLAADLYSGSRIAGDASEPSVLKQAGVGKADLLITATHDDNVNLMVALVAKKVLGARKVMARVYDPAREELYRDVGLETVCPTLIAGEAFFKLLYQATDHQGAEG